MTDIKEIKAKYINPYTDFGFKRLFGVEANKDLLIDFLNQMLPTKHQIKSLVFKNTENIPELSEDRKAIFDIHLEEFNDIPTILNEPVFQQAFKTAEIANLSKEEYKKYLDSLDAYREIKGVTENAIEEGWNNALIETAKNGINAGFDNDVISKMTKLSDKQINDLRKQIENE